MNILFLSHYYSPHTGGVETHIQDVSKQLVQKGHNITTVTKKYNKQLKDNEDKNNLQIIRLPYKEFKILGIISIWSWFLKHRKIIYRCDVIHCHDVFIWYFPFRFLYPNKNLVVTVHGLEWDNPLLIKSLFQKKMAVRLSNKSVGIGHFLEKYIGKKFDLVSYGAADIHNYKTQKDRNRIAYVGRLEENTGLLQFLKWLDKNPKYEVDFCGDGELRTKCEKYGTVHGFCDPNPYYKICKTVVPGGYLAALEALNSGCDIKLFWNNKIKEDYWKMSPFYKLKGEKLKTWARKQTWEKLANEYLDLYNSIK